MAPSRLRGQHQSPLPSWRAPRCSLPWGGTVPHPPGWHQVRWPSVDRGGEDSIDFAERDLDLRRSPVMTVASSNRNVVGTWRRAGTRVCLLHGDPGRLGRGGEGARRDISRERVRSGTSHRTFLGVNVLPMQSMPSFLAGGRAGAPAPGRREIEAAAGRLAHVSNHLKTRFRPRLSGVKGGFNIVMKFDGIGFQLPTPLRGLRD